MGRNFDFPGFLRDLYGSYGNIVVMNPVGGEHGVAGIGVPEMITGFGDAINNERLYFEFIKGDQYDSHAKKVFQYDRN